jgi:hypothetical protein
MFDLPSDFCEAELVGHVLEMVCVGPYFTRLEFSKPNPGANESDSFYVGVKGSVFIFNGAHEIECCAENPSSMARLVDFLLLKIKAANRQGTSSLELVFEDDRKLLLSGDDSPEYESYSIQVFGKNVVVV